MAVTIKDVAQKAGVSTATVSKVMNGSPSISEATALRIKAVMEELHYQPNLRARNFARQSTKTVLFATELWKNCAFENPHIFEIMVGLQRSMEAKGYGFHIVNVSKENSMEVLKNTIAQKSADGIVLHISIVSKELEKVILKEEFPHIVLGCPEYKTQLCWIDNNNTLSGEIAARYLLERGYRKIAFIGGRKNDVGSECRRQGFLNIMEAEKIMVPEEYIRTGESSIEMGWERQGELLSLAKRPDAVICANNYLALGAMNRMQEAGISVPDEMGLITFDAYPFTGITNPQMTTVDIDVYDMGKQAGEIILRKIRKPNLQIQSYTTLANLMINGSTR